MGIERNIAEALAAEAEQVALTPELWTRVRANMGASTQVGTDRWQRGNRAGRSYGRRRGWAALAGAVMALTLAVLLALPSARMTLAQWLGVAFEQVTSTNLIIRRIVTHQPLSNLTDDEQGPDGVPRDRVASPDLIVREFVPEPLSDVDSYEYFLYDVPKDRWSLIHGNGFRIPQPGERIALPSGDRLIVPSYVPDGFLWQGVVVTNESMFLEGFVPMSSASAGGGGLEPMPDYDRSFANFLIGGDAVDRFLVLGQFRDQRETGLSIRPFLTLSPDREPAPNVAEQSQPGNVVPTPTPAPQAYRAKLQLGLFIEPSHVESGITLMVGPEDVHEVGIGDFHGWWYTGVWTLEGTWNPDPTLTNLVWQQGDHVYQLVGEGLDVETMIRVAASIS